MTLLGTAAALMLGATPTGPVFEMAGSFDVVAPLEIAWGVLTDYGSHAGFVAELKSSTVKGQTPGVTMVAQEAIGKVAMFSATVALLLRMTETPHTQIVFTDTLKKDFGLFEGRWTIAHAGTGVHVGYTLKCQPRSTAPSFIVRSVMEDSTRRLMVAMRGEIERRVGVKVADR